MVRWFTFLFLYTCAPRSAHKRSRGGHEVNTSHIMPQSRVALANSLSDTLASLQTARSGLTNVWALRMSTSEKAHFAALKSRCLSNVGGLIDTGSRTLPSTPLARHHLLACIHSPRRSSTALTIILFYLLTFLFSFLLFSFSLVSLSHL